MTRESRFLLPPPLLPFFFPRFLFRAIRGDPRPRGKISVAQSCLRLRSRETYRLKCRAASSSYLNYRILRHKRPRVRPRSEILCHARAGVSLKIYVRESFNPIPILTIAGRGGGANSYFLQHYYSTCAICTVISPRRAIYLSIRARRMNYSFPHYVAAKFTQQGPERFPSSATRGLHERRYGFLSKERRGKGVRCF